jgi:hypothetical protein
MTLGQNAPKETESGASKSQPNRTAGLARRCFQLALALFFIGLVPTVLAMWGERRATANAAWRDPADNVEAAAVAPDLALLSLAGVPDNEILTLAMDKGELATAYALLALSPDLADARRTSGWLWLAHRYHQGGQAQQAAQAFRLAGNGAVLGEDLPDLSRVETLLAVGKGLNALHDKLSAHAYLSQAAAIGAYAPNLTDYDRRSLLERLLPAIVRAGGQRRDWITLSKTVENDTNRGDSVFGVRSSNGQNWLDFQSAGDAALVQARDARRAATAALLRAMSEAPNAGSSNVAAQQALRDALLTEDAAVERYTEQYAETRVTDLAAQQVRLRWLLLKRRVAAGGAGAGLMPEWESDREAIDSALSDTWSNWLALQIVPPAMGTAADYRNLSAPIARQALVVAYWGLYPGAPVADLVTAAQATSDSGRLRLTVLRPGTPPVVGWSEQTREP